MSSSPSPSSSVVSVVSAVSPASALPSLTAPRVRVVPGGLALASGEVVPLYAASVHYWRHPVGDWRACLEAVRGMGFRMIDTYIPWAVHERGPGEFDFGEHEGRLDVVRFLRAAQDLGLSAIVRPGPHINAELTFFGLPKRIIWNPACQAQSPTGCPVILPMLPVSFPVPSYASEVFHQETARFFQALAPRLAPLRAPDGPIVMVQVDNEGALFFRDSAYDQDYHPDAIAQYRRFLREKYPSDEALRQAYGSSVVDVAAVEPPARFDATNPEGLLRHLDWVEFHEELLAGAFRRMATTLAEAGLAGIPTSHNLPFGQETTPLNPARLGRSIDLIALDYYHKATPLDRTVIARRTTELVTRCEGRGHPAFAAEMGAGFPPFFPPIDETDSAFTLLCALAYGLRGFNLYMAVERDRWIGAPVDPHGRRRPFADFYESLCGALEALDFPNLRRRMPVRLVTPRSLRRLTRVMHAFGPATGALFAVLGAGAQERCFEDDLGLGGPIAIEGDAFIRAFEQALDGRGVPFGHVGGEDADVALDGARWVVCASTGGLKPALLQQLIDLAGRGTRVTIGPRKPERDGAMRPLMTPPDLTGVELLMADPPAVGLDPATVDRMVAKAIETLALPTFACDVAGVYATVHEDAAGKPRAVFVINPGPDDVVARVTVPSVQTARDALTEQNVHARAGTLEVRVPPRTVRLLAVTTGEP